MLSAAVVAGHLLTGFDHSEFEIGIRNALHILLFGIFALIIFESLKKLKVTTAIIVTVAIIAMVGGLAEFAQFRHGKQIDLSDIGRDLTGAVLCLGAWLLWRRSFANSDPRFRNNLYRVASALIVFLILSPLVYWLTVFQLSRSTFPVIVSFDHWWDKHLYSPVNSEISVSTGSPESLPDDKTVAAIHFSGTGRSGLTIRPVISNWSDYEYLTIEAAIFEGPNTFVTVRIFDEQGIRTFDERHVTRLTILRESTVYRILLSDIAIKANHRTLDLSDVKQLVIYVRKKSRRDGTVMLLDEIRLE